MPKSRDLPELPENRCTVEPQSNGTRGLCEVSDALRYQKLSSYTKKNLYNADYMNFRFKGGISLRDRVCSGDVLLLRSRQVPPLCNACEKVNPLVKFMAVYRRKGQRSWKECLEDVIRRVAESKDVAVDLNRHGVNVSYKVCSIIQQGEFLSKMW